MFMRYDNLCNNLRENIYKWEAVSGFPRQMFGMAGRQTGKCLTDGIKRLKRLFAKELKMMLQVSCFARHMNNHHVHHHHHHHRHIFNLDKANRSEYFNSSINYKWGISAHISVAVVGSQTWRTRCRDANLYWFCLNCFIVCDSLLPSADIEMMYILVITFCNVSKASYCAIFKSHLCHKHKHQQPLKKIIFKRFSQQRK